MKFNEYPTLDAPPAQDDTYLVYDKSSGNIKRIQDQNVAARTVGGRRLFVQSDQPTDTESSVGDLWIDIT